MGMGAIQASLAGSAGRLGKYFVWRFARKSGSEGSRSGAEGPGGKCVVLWSWSWVWVSACVWECGWGLEMKRSADGSGGAVSSSNVTFFFGSSVDALVPLSLGLLASAGGVIDKVSSTDVVAGP